MSAILTMLSVIIILMLDVWAEYKGWWEFKKDHNDDWIDYE